MQAVYTVHKGQAFEGAIQAVEMVMGCAGRLLQQQPAPSLELRSRQDAQV
jgi:hypothetical protein